PLTLLMPEEYRAAHLAGLQRVAAGGAPRLFGRTLELQGLRRGGEVFALELSISRWSSNQGGFFTAVMRDVTARKLNADALRRSEEQFRLTIDNAPIGMALVDLNGRFLRVNRALCEIVGYASDELVTRTFQQLTHPDDLEADLDSSTRLVEGEIASYSLHKRYMHRDGHPVNVMLHVALVRDRAGAPLHFTVQIEDISAKLRAEGELAHKTMILESVLNHMSDGVVVADVHGEVLLFNPAAHAMFGRRPDSAYSDWAAEQGLFAADGVTPLDAAQVPMRRALQGEFVDQVALLALPHAGSTGRWRSVTATPLRDANGTVWAALSVSRDITRFKESEIALREQAAIIRLLEAIAVAANEATTSWRAMKDSLKLVCEFMGWPVGHVYQVDGSRLLPSDLWHLKDPERFAAFREVTSRTHLAAGLGLPGRALATGRPAWMEDVQIDRAFLRARAATSLGVHGGVAIPVMVDNEVTAVMEFYSDSPQVPDSRALEVLHHVGTQLGRVVERERHAEAVRSLSLTDELTGLNNRRGFLALAEAQLRLAARHARPACLLFIDMDGLKQINDHLGHEMGDAAIADVATVLRAAFRESDILGRLGGDEFVALLMDVGGPEHAASMHRLHEAMTLHNVTHSRSYVLAVSVGATSFDPHKPEDIESLLARADSLMYEQKRRRKGRGSIIMTP
ncbi:MAG TPA: PAS domain S-box protein, partial [Polyangiales bacterium]